MKLPRRTTPKKKRVHNMTPLFPEFAHACPCHGPRKVEARMVDKGLWPERAEWRWHVICTWCGRRTGWRKSYDAAVRAWNQDLKIESKLVKQETL